jgi:phosphinothricin acetyltransferase
MPGTQVRPVSTADRDAIIEIFNHYVTTGFAAYPDKPVPQAFFETLREGAYAFPVIESEEELVGFGILRPFLPFTTFARTATVTTFVSPTYRHQKYGSIILRAMTDAAAGRRIVTLLANISSKNTESLKFHAKHGFFECGRMLRVGSKFNELFDIVWMQKNLEHDPGIIREEIVPGQGTPVTQKRPIR